MTIYAVNGKEPIAAWIPSLDTAGNGTTTLNDLVSTNHGTLTNMDPATDWVADTDAGGVRALDFDGLNDTVTLPTPTQLQTQGNYSVSLWAKLTTTVRGMMISIGDGANNGFNFDYGGNVSTMLSVHHRTNAGGALGTRTSNPVNTGSWVHVVAVMLPNYSAATSSVALFLNGVAGGVVIAGAGNAVVPTSVGRLGSRIAGGNFYTGRLDDIRIFNSALDSSDVAYLYNSGNGRGRVATPSNRNNALVGVGF